MQRLPINRTGLGIPSFKEVAEKITLKKRHAMKNNQSSVAQQIWSETSSKHIATDELINKTASLRAASIQLTNKQTQEAWSHVQSLTVHGTSVTSIVENILKKNMRLVPNLVKPSRAHLQLRTKSADQPTAY